MELLCHICGNGLLEPVQNTRWLQCTECHRGVHGDDLERSRRDAEQRQLTREAEACFREDQFRRLPDKRTSSDRTGKASGSCGTAYVESTAGRTDTPAWRTEEEDVILSQTVVSVGKVPVSFRPAAALRELFQHLGLDRNQQSEAVRQAVRHLCEPDG